jgi:fermentation-respiration switch protein FrsA (DUF1100 family)
MTSFLLTALLVYGALLAGLYVMQRHLLYFPARDLQPPATYGLQGFREISLTAADAVKLTAWEHLPQPGFATIVYFHGNAGHLGNRAAKYQALARAGFGVMALEYRGFGTSEGTPSEQGLYADARAAIAYLRTIRGVPLSQIMLYGESLGSGVAVQMATEYPVAGIILEAPYTSIVRRGQARYPFIPVARLLKDRYESLAKMDRVHAPLLLFHGERDAVVPVEDGRALLAAAHAPKEGRFYPTVDHTQFPLDDLTETIRRFGGAHGWCPAAHEP